MLKKNVGPCHILLLICWVKTHNDNYGLLGHHTYFLNVTIFYFPWANFVQNVLLMRLVPSPNHIKMMGQQQERTGLPVYRWSHRCALIKFISLGADRTAPFDILISTKTWNNKGKLNRKIWINTFLAPWTFRSPVKCFAPVRPCPTRFTKDMILQISTKCEIE